MKTWNGNVSSALLGAAGKGGAMCTMTAGFWGRARSKLCVVIFGIFLCAQHSLAQVTTDLSISVTDSPDPLLFGNTLTYTVTVTNLGPGNTVSVSVRQSLPRDMTFVSSSPSQGTCGGVLRQGVDTVVICNLSVISNGASATITTSIIPTSSPVIFNNFTVTDPFITDPNPANNSASANTTMVAGASLTILKAGTGSGTVTSSTAGINCGVDCLEVYNFGTLVTLTASPEAGSVFAGWSGGGCMGLDSCMVTMNAANSVTANFDLVPSTSKRADFNADGKSDVFWRHSDGTNYIWNVDGTSINGGVLAITSQGLLPGVPGSDWAIVGIGDFNGDGKADILWRHTDGTNYVWHLDGSTINGGVLSIVSQGLLPGVPAGWSVVGIGDFNGDGKSDILWRHTNGTNYVWHLDGSTINGGVLSIVSQGLLPMVDATWSVAGVGDINGDGKADILWRKNEGTNYVWHINGATINGGVLSIVSQGLLPGVDATWSVVGVGDYNGDGKADVLWRRNDGTNYVWHVNGAVINGGVLSITTQGLLPSVTDMSWSVVGWGDYNGDGKADIFWRHANGTNYVWHVDGATINGGVLAIPSQGLLPAVADMGWQVQNPR